MSRIGASKKVLAIRFGSLGDVVLTLPAIRLLKQRANVTVTYLTRRPYGDLLRLAPDIDETIATKGTVAEAFANLRAYRDAGSDGVLDLHSSLRSRYLEPIVGGQTFRIQTDHWQRRMVVWKKRALLDSISRWKRYVQVVNRLLEHWGDALAEEDEVSGPFFGSRIASHVDSSSKAQVALFPGAAWRTKQWPEAHYVALAKLLHHAGIGTVVLGSPAERALVGRITRETGSDSYADGCWEAFLVTLQKCQLAVGNDSGLAHVAEAMDIPVITLFGPTVPCFGFAPRLKKSFHLELELTCRPCSLHGGQECPLKHLACLNGITPYAVATAIYRALER